MNDKMLKYEFNANEANTLLNVLNKTQIAGVENAKALLDLVGKLQKPVNSDELEKETYDALKTKFEKQDEKKK